MSRTKRHIKSQYNIINEVSYAILQQSTTATFISKETMETTEKTESKRQEIEVVSNESALAKNPETEGQEKTESIGQIMENEAIGYASSYV